jgi:predicted transcriptional regulator
MRQVEHENSRRISVSLTLEEILSLKEIAVTQDRSVSWVAARAIRLYLSERRKDSDAFETSGTSGTEDER